MNEGLRLSQSCNDYARRAASFLKGATDCPMIVFTWYDAQSAKPPHFQIGAEERMISEYYDEYVHNDPLRADRLIERSRKVETLASAKMDHDPFQLEKYQPFLEKYRIKEEIDFVFWAGEHAVASAALLNTAQSPLPLSSAKIAEIQQFLEYTFSLVPAIKALNIRKKLSLNFGLTPKELIVAEMLISGEPNKSIASNLGLELATVKTHLIHIFQKLQVQSRSKAIALLGNLA